jgi:hypothetical protein
VGDKNKRGGSTSARGDTLSPGVYELLASAKGLLHKQRILTGWTPPLRAGEEELYYNPKSQFCVYAARYTLKKSE